MSQCWGVLLQVLVPWAPATRFLCLPGFWHWPSYSSGEATPLPRRGGKCPLRRSSPLCTDWTVGRWQSRISSVAAGSASSLADRREAGTKQALQKKPLCFQKHVLYLLTEYRETTLFPRKFNTFWRRDLLLTRSLWASQELGHSHKH